MGYSIYFFKMQLLSEQFEMNDEERRGVKGMAIFIALFHSAAFLKPRLSSISTACDLNLSMMHLYKEENPAAAKVVIESVLKQLWYPTEKVVVLSIFDGKLDPLFRKCNVEKLISFIICYLSHVHRRFLQKNRNSRLSDVIRLLSFRINCS